MPTLESGKARSFRDAIDQLGPDEASRAFLEDLLALEGFQDCWQGKPWAVLEIDDDGALLQLTIDMPGRALVGEPSLPTSVGACARLQSLTLRKMGLGGLCEELGNCVELTRLSVPGNPLRGDVPESLNNLTALKTFCIDDCQITGRFLPMELFKRMACDAATYIYLASNSFADINFSDYGLNQYTTGVIRPWVPDRPGKKHHVGSVAVSSFPGQEFMQWMLMLMRHQTYHDSTVHVATSELCVFLADYATARTTDEAIDEWHAGGYCGSPECQLHAQYFDAASKGSGGATVLGHKKFGCMWFHKWAINQVKAVMAGHKRFMVFTLCPVGDAVERCYGCGKVGTCQKAEIAFLKAMAAAYPGVEVRVRDVDNLEYFMKEPLEYWNNQEERTPEGCEDVFESPPPFPREEYERMAAEA